MKHKNVEVIGADNGKRGPKRAWSIFVNGTLIDVVYGKKLANRQASILRTKE
jgi:hypothetical protein